MYPLFCSSQCAQYNAVGARKHVGIYLHHKMSVLWDSNNPKYCNKLHKHGAGKRIAQGMGTVPEECKKKMDIYFLLLEEKGEENRSSPQLVN
jgi:hypothetical protein